MPVEIAVAMKPRSYFILSLALNLVLAAVFLVYWRTPSAPNAAPNNKPAAPITPPSVTPVAPISAAMPSTTNTPFHWRMVESDDYRQYISNLQAIGCPERTIRDLIVADIDQLYASKNRSAPIVPPPWENHERRHTAERVQAANRSALQAEKRALVKELIGYEWDNHANEVWHDDFGTSLVLGFLPDLKAPQLMALFEKHSELARGVRDDAGDILIDEDLARLRQIYNDLVTEATQLLAPAEREELELRIQAALFLPGAGIYWDGVAISGPELREYVRLSRNHLDPFQREFLGLGTPSDAEQIRMKAAFERQVEKFLGPKRFADYQRAQDGAFRDTFEFTQERHLPKTAAIRIDDLRHAAETQASQLQQDTSLSAEEQTAALAVLKAAAAGSVVSALGKSSSDYLSGPGQWLEALSAPSEMEAQNRSKTP